MKNNRILLVIDKDTTRLSFVKALEVDEIREIHVCPMDYRAEETADQILKDLSSRDVFKVHKVNFLDCFNRKAFDLKDQYIEFIRNIGETRIKENTSLRQYFRYPGEDFSVWWFSLIAEKNPYKTESFTLFVKVLTLLHLKGELGCDKIIMEENSSYLREVLESCEEELLINKSKGNVANSFRDLKCVFLEQLRVMKFLFELIGKVRGAKRLKKKFNNYDERFKGSKLAILTGYPYVDKNQLKKGNFVNLLFGSFQEALQDVYKEQCVWIGKYGYIDGNTWEDTLEITEGVKKADNFFLLEEGLGYKDILIVVRNYFILSLKCLLKTSQIEAFCTFKDRQSQHTINFWAILKSDFYSSFLGKYLILGLTDYLLFLRAFEKLTPGTKVLYFAEVQGWEKALNIACSKSKGIECIGIQHAVVPLLFMNYFDHPKDLEGVDYLQYSPAPKRMGCVGTITKNILSDSGFPRDRLFTLGGFRYSELRGENNPHKEQLAGAPQIVVAFSICEWENEEILWMLYKAFQNSEEKIEILLKSHPCCPIEKTLQKMNITLNESMFRVTNRPLREIVPGARAMIVKESSSLFWAMHHQIPIVIPNLYNIVDLCPLSGLSDVHHYVNSAEELKKVIRDICEDKVEINETSYREFLSKYFEIYEDPKRYCDNLREYVN